MIAHPRATLDELSRQTSIRPAVILAVFPVLLGWLNLLLFVAFGYDWLGTRREMLNPTYVGFFGHLRVGTENYIPIFQFIISPLPALLGLAILPGVAQVPSKLWRGQGTFEQMTNTLTYSMAPSILVRSVVNDMLLGGVPANLVAGHLYALAAAMNGEFGPVMAMVFWINMLGIYILGFDLWVVILGTIAIRRVQRIPWWAAALIMLFAYLLWFYGLNG